MYSGNNFCNLEINQVKFDLFLDLNKYKILKILDQKGFLNKGLFEFLFMRMIMNVNKTQNVKAISINEWTNRGIMVELEIQTSFLIR